MNYKTEQKLETLARKVKKIYPKLKEIWLAGRIKNTDIALEILILATLSEEEIAEVAKIVDHEFYDGPISYLTEWIFRTIE